MAIHAAGFRETTGLERVSIGPPAEWVTVRDVDASFRPRTNSSAALLLWDRQYLAAGHAEYQRTVQRLESMQAVQQAAQWRMSFDPATQHVVIHGIIIHRGSEATEHAHFQRIRLLQREENLERLILDGAATLVALLEDVRVGDLLDVSFSIMSQPRLFRDNFSLLVAPPAHVTLRAFHLSVRFPAERPMQWKGSSSPPQSRELQGDREWHWMLENVGPLIPEEGIPSWSLPENWIQVSDFPSWAEVARELAAAWREQPANVEQMAGEIFSAEEDLNGRAERAIAFVQDEIRYLSVNIAWGGQIPTPPDEVLRRRFGDCKDKAFLLAQVLQQLGVPAHPVLVSVALQGTVRNLLPTPAAFDHCLVECEIEGQRRWIDATIAQQGGGPLRRQVPDFEVGLPLRLNVVELEQIPAESRRDDHYILKENLLPDTAGGDSVLEAVTILKGLCADHFRHRFANEGPDEVAKSREELYRQRYPRLTRQSSIKWRDDRAANTFTIAEAFAVPDLVGRSGSDSMYSCLCEAHLIMGSLAVPSTAARKFPLDFTRPRLLEHWIELEVANPSFGPLNSVIQRTATFEFQRQLRRNAVVYSLRTFKNVVLPSAYPMHVAAVQKISNVIGLHFSLPGGIQIPRRAQRFAALPASGSQRQRFMPGAKAKNPFPSRIPDSVPIEEGMRKRTHSPRSGASEMPTRNDRRSATRRLPLGLLLLVGALALFLAWAVYVFLMF